MPGRTGDHCFEASLMKAAKQRLTGDENKSENEQP